MDVPTASTRPATLRDAAAFFLPLIFMAELMMITHTVIHAWLARGALPTVSLAAFSIAFALNGLLSSAFRPLHQIALTFISDRRSMRRVWSFGMIVAAVNMGLMACVALTPLGDWIYGGLLGASPAVVREARAASAFFVFIFPLQCTRNVSAGLLMVQRRTLLISYGTIMRVVALGALLIALSGVIGGAALGAAALVGCIAVEAAFVVGATRPFYRLLPDERGATPGYGEILRFGWPVIANAMLENGLVVLVNVFVGRLTHPDASLAAFGVARGLLMLMMSPLRNLAQTAQALTHAAADMRMVLRFTRRVILGFMLLIGVLFYTPLRGVILGSWMGLEPALQAAVEPALQLFVIAPPLWAMAAVYRGLLARARQTGVLAFSGGVRLGAVTAVSSVCLFWPDANGAVVGVLAMAAAFASEALLLGRSVRGYQRRGLAFAPPRNAEPASGDPVPGSAVPAGDTR